MNLIVYAIFGVVILLLLIQFIYIIRNASNNREKKQNNQNNKVYSKEISELGEKTMCAVKAGKVKKQLLSNDAPEYDSNNALEQYVAFVDQSTVYKKVMSIKEQKFYG